jgi:signal transduction histidine kinase
MVLLLGIKNQKSKRIKLQFTQEQNAADQELYDLLLSQQNKIEDVRKHEKQRIARDLHDGVLNQLASTRLNLFAISKKTNVQTLERFTPFITGIQTIEKEIRSISHGLNDFPPVDKDNFQHMIEDLVENQKVIGTINYSCQIDQNINWDNFTTLTKIHIYRIVQEAIQNANLYSGAGNIEISFSLQKIVLRVRISDDGNGFNINSKKSGIGIKNMKSRAEEISARFKIKSKISSGTKVLLFINK